MNTIAPSYFAEHEYPHVEQYDNYGIGVHTLDRDIKTYKAVSCESRRFFNGNPLKQCIATLVIPKGTTIVVPQPDNIRSNRAFVADIECMYNGNKIYINEFGRCKSFFDPSFKYNVKTTVASDLNTNGSATCAEGIHSVFTREEAKKWCDVF